MGDVEIKLKKAGFRATMKSGGIKALLGQSVGQMGSAAESSYGSNYVSNVQDGKVSAHGLVGTGDRRAARDNAKHNTLLKSIDAGRV